MKATRLYQRLERDFIHAGIKDEWAEHMSSVMDFLSDNFKRRSMGLVCDFTDEIAKVYSAVFPSAKVMEKILEGGAENGLLFVHHPSIWDVRKAPEVFQQMDRNFLQKFKNQKISIYNLHTPLDNYGEHSTSVSLAKALQIKVKKPFTPYFGALCGVFGTVGLSNVQDLGKRFEAVVGHRTILYKYGNNKIRDKAVAVVAGGGNSIEILKEIAEQGVNTLVTGITLKNDHSIRAHEFAEEKKINILGGTHYSTERFACIAMCGYFDKVGLPCVFIEDDPVMEDM